MKEDDFEVLEPKEYTGKKDESYSHPALLMNVLKKAVENGSKEMREGYWNTKFDRLGNAHRVWIPDSRKEFIETIESLKMIQERDFDTDVRERIKKIKEDLKKKYEDYCDLEKKGWETAPIQLKNEWNRKGDFHREGMLSKSLPYVFEYIEDQVKVAREIVSIIQHSISRRGDYQEEIYEA